MRRQSDERLLAAGGADGFVELYRRHERPMLGYFVRRGADAQLAVDLTAETFTRALEVRARFQDRGDGSAAAWLYGIARNVHLELARDALRARKAAERLAGEPIELRDEQREAVARLSHDDGLRDALAALPPEQAEAVWRYVVDDEGYDELSAKLGTSESAIRQRVSRGLRGLRRGMEDER